jgi:hypothetical protein
VPAELTKDQETKVSSQRKSNRPSIYNPNDGGAVTISRDLEQWLILTPKDTKAKIVDWIKELKKAEVDEDFQDLLKETLDKEEASLSIQQMDLEAQLTQYLSWRNNPNISGYEDVAEIGWLFQELQQGFSPRADLDVVEHASRLRQGVADRLPTSQDSEDKKTTRLDAWLAVLNSY